MNFINKVIERIEKGNLFVLGFKYDNETPKGSKANAIGLVRYEGKWYVQFETLKYEGSCDCMNLVQYMELTKDIK